MQLHLRTTHNPNLFEIMMSANMTIVAMVEKQVDKLWVITTPIPPRSVIDVGVRFGCAESAFAFYDNAVKVGALNPVHFAIGDKPYSSTRPDDSHIANIREQAAMAAMQGYLASFAGIDAKIHAQDVAALSVECADALVKELYPDG